MNKTDYCPNCDAKLPVAIWDGEEWNCGECGESGIYAGTKPGPFAALSELLCDRCGKPGGVYREYETIPGSGYTKTISTVICDDCLKSEAWCIYCGYPVNADDAYTVRLSDEEFAHLKCYDKNNSAVA
jgi:hypothetical protein